MKYDGALRDCLELADDGPAAMRLRSAAAYAYGPSVSATGPMIAESTTTIEEVPGDRA